MVVAGLQLGENPFRFGVGEEAHAVDEVGAVAEEHGARSAQVGDDAMHFADGVAADGFAGDIVVGTEAVGVVDGEEGTAGFAGRDHAVALVDGSGERFFADDALDAGGGGGDDDVGVAVVGGDDAEDVKILFVEHGVEVGVGFEFAELVPPHLRDSLEQLRLQLADSDEVCLRIRVKCAQMGGWAGRVQNGPRFGGRTVGGNAGESDHADAILLSHLLLLPFQFLHGNVEFLGPVFKLGEGVGGDRDSFCQAPLP